MKLFLVTSIDFPYGGAQSVLTSWAIKGFRENKIEPFLIIPYGTKREALELNKKNYGHFDGVPYCFIRRKKSINKLFIFIDKYLGVFNTSILIIKRHRKKKLDSVILGGIPDLLRDFPIVVTCLIFKIPVYLWFVEKASLSEDYRGISGFLNKQSQKITEQILPKFANGIIVISSYLRKYYIKYLPEKKILTIPILVSIDMNKLGNTLGVANNMKKIKSLVKDNKLLVYSGSFDAKDGIFDLIDAFHKFLNKNPDSLFVMTGKNNDQMIMKKVKNYINQYNLLNKIILTGFVTSVELHCYNYLADILFVCRINSPFANHGFPWKLGEYCMTGKPIIATRVGDIEYYFKNSENLFIVEASDSEAIAEKMSSIFENYPKALEVAKRGKATALVCFDYVKRMEEIIEFVKANNNNF